MADQAVADDPGADHDHLGGAGYVTHLLPHSVLALLRALIYRDNITAPASLSERAYREIRRRIIALDLAPGAVLRDDELQSSLGLGRTPIREALQRLERDQFVTVIPRRGMFVSSIDVGELSTLYETRAILEPYATRLACARGTAPQWSTMRALLNAAAGGTSPADLIDVDRACHEIIWAAANNRFLTDTLDMLYAHSDRLWHIYLADVADMAEAVHEHSKILDALESGDSDGAAALVEQHVRHFDQQIRDAVRRRLEPPLPADGGLSSR